jgi:hypothetical protein
MVYLLDLAEAGTTRHVSATDATCGGQAPCYGTIQAAVTAAQPGDTVAIGAGTYVEQVAIVGKNNNAAATEATRIVIEADPDAPMGSVVLRGAAGHCSLGHAIQIQQSRFVTVRGLTITGAGGQAIALAGGGSQSHSIHLERNRIFGNGGPSCSGGITINRGNSGTLIANNLIYGNGRQGLLMSDTQGGPHTIVGNTIHGNGWSGVSVSRGHQVLMVNNAITANGTAAGTTGGRFGLSREGSAAPDRAGIRLVGNAICGNRLGEIDGPVLDATDAGNLTPTGVEGHGVTASALCGNTAVLYVAVTGPDQLAFTADDDFTPATGSPLVDGGADPRLLGLPATLNTLFEGDFHDAEVRPQAGGGAGPATFDIGAIERLPAGDTLPPTVTIVEPGTAFVRGAVTITVQAADSGNVSLVTIAVDGQPLAIRREPDGPAPLVTATAQWSSAGAGDGPHTISATATDAAGNQTTTQKVAISDATPPHTHIVSGPIGTVGGPSATFTFGGTDNVSAADNLVFAWRVDGGAFSAFASSVTAALDDLAPGSHTFEVKSRDQAGNEDASPALRAFVVGSVQIAIASPAAGAIVPIGALAVTGTVAVEGGETGVTVNDVSAVVQGGMFAAIVPVDGTTTSLIAVARSASGMSATHTIDISVSAVPLPGMALVVNPNDGVAPLRVSFTAPRAGVSVTLDYEGDGVADFTGSSLDGQAFTYTRPGIYSPVAVVTDGAGRQTTATGLVNVRDRAQLDDALKARWNDMKAALVRGDVETALAHFTPGQQPRFRTLLTALGSQAAQIAQDMEDIHLVYAIEGHAKYRLRRTQPYGGQMTTLTYYVYFVQDDAGAWTIAGF